MSLPNNEFILISWGQWKTLKNHFHSILYKAKQNTCLLEVSKPIMFHDADLSTKRCPTLLTWPPSQRKDHLIIATTDSRPQRRSLYWGFTVNKKEAKSNNVFLIVPTLVFSWFYTIVKKKKASAVCRFFL